MIIIFVPIAIVGIILSFGRGKVVDFLSRPITIYSILILWTLFGFVFVLDNSTAWGCIIGPEQVLSIENISYSGLSVLFITIGFFWSGRGGLIILFGELIYWTIKLMKRKEAMRLD